VDKDPKKSTPFAQPMETPVRDSDMKELFRRLKPEMRRPKPGSDEVAAALEAAQRLAAEADAEDAADDLSRELGGEPSAAVCSVCGYHNRVGTKFCGMCGVAVGEAKKIESAESGAPTAAIASPQTPFPAPDMRPPVTGPTGYETHHYHHHYHHHYFPGAQEGSYQRPVDDTREIREERMRPTAALRGDMSRAEAAVRRVTHEWVLACNTKHLDDLLELYVSDALVLRSNYAPIRGAAAVREFFFGALDAGLGEVEIDPLRVDVVGDLAYEAGRFSALIPGSTGKRREERGKYLWVFARQGNSEWKLAADCWSSDLTLMTLESDVPSGAGVKTNQPRKNG
jgi:ketosteroid isomerase-like protein